MSTAVKKAPPKAAAVKKGKLSPAIVTTARTISKAGKTTVIKAKKAATVLTKKEHTEPVMRTMALSRAAGKLKALSKEQQEKRQGSKTTKRKQGGVKYGVLPEQQVRVLAHVQQSGPTKVE